MSDIYAEVKRNGRFSWYVTIRRVGHPEPQRELTPFLVFGGESRAHRLATRALTFVRKRECAHEWREVGYGGAGWHSIECTACGMREIS